MKLLTPCATLALAILFGVTACKGGDKKAEPAPGSAAPGGGAPKAPPATKDLADSADPTGIEWKRVEQPFGSLELPTGPAWAMVDNQLEGKDETVIMLQAQDGIGPEQLDEYLASYDEVQRRDAPKYVGAAPTKGTVGGQVAARVEGAFDNGTKFVTRDFLIFAKGKVVLLSARTPATNAAALPGLIDHAARSLQVR